MSINELRRKYHERICKEIIRIKTERKKQLEYPNFSDGSQKSSRDIGMGIVKLLGWEINNTEELKEQTAGNRFEKITLDFLKESFLLLQHIRPGKWQYHIEKPISEFHQYSYLREKSLTNFIGGVYIVKPDIVISRLPISDQDINQTETVIDDSSPIATYTSLREENYQKEVIRKGKKKPTLEVSPILHASISCKWSLRSDRSQNARLEALNLIRYRTGHLPHIVAITAEPTPHRIASLAQGTGDIDCVYHFALPELRAVVSDLKNEDQHEILTNLINGRRLRDISDLPFDLAT
jgi:hypothetical protein